MVFPALCATDFDGGDENYAKLDFEICSQFNVIVFYLNLVNALNLYMLHAGSTKNYVFYLLSRLELVQIVL